MTFRYRGNTHTDVKQVLIKRNQECVRVIWDKTERKHQPAVAQRVHLRERKRFQFLTSANYSSLYLSFREEKVRFPHTHTHAHEEILIRLHRHTRTNTYILYTKFAVCETWNERRRRRRIWSFCFWNMERKRKAKSMIFWLVLFLLMFCKFILIRITKQLEVKNHFWSSSTSWTSLWAFSPSPGMSVVQSVRLSRNSCMINVESIEKQTIIVIKREQEVVDRPLYVSSLSVSNSAMASSNAWKTSFSSSDLPSEHNTDLFC